MISVPALCLLTAALPLDEHAVPPRLFEPLSKVLADLDGHSITYRYRLVEFDAERGGEPKSVEDGAGTLTISTLGLTNAVLCARIIPADRSRLVYVRRTTVYDAPTGECATIESFGCGGDDVVWLEPWVETPPEFTLLCGLVPEGESLPAMPRGTLATLPDGLIRETGTNTRGDGFAIDYDSATGTISRFELVAQSGSRCAYTFLGRAAVGDIALPLQVVETISIAGKPVRVRVLERWSDPSAASGAPVSIPPGATLMEFRRPGVTSTSVSLDRRLSGAGILSWPPPQGVEAMPATTIAPLVIDVESAHLDGMDMHARAPSPLSDNTTPAHTAESSRRVVIFAAIVAAIALVVVAARVRARRSHV